MRLPSSFGSWFRIDLQPRLDVPRIVVDADVVQSDGIEQSNVVLGRDPVFQRDDDAGLLGVAGHFLHHRDKRVDLLLVLHVDVAVAEDGQQDVVRPRGFAPLRRLRRAGWPRPDWWKRQRRLTGRPNRERAIGCRSRAGLLDPPALRSRGSDCSRLETAGSPESRRARSGGPAPPS